MNLGDVVFLDQPLKIWLLIAVLWWFDIRLRSLERPQKEKARKERLKRRMEKDRQYFCDTGSPAPGWVVDSDLDDYERWLKEKKPSR